MRTEAKKIYLIAGVFGIMALFLIFGLIFFQLKEIKKTSGIIASQKRETAYFELKKDNIKTLKKTYETNLLDFNKIDTLFIDQKLPIDFINFLEKTTTNLGLESEISPAGLPSQKDVLWKSLTFEISLNGTFPKLWKFLEKIENSSYLVDVETMIAQKPKGIMDENIQAKLLLRVMAK